MASAAGVDVTSGEAAGAADLDKYYSDISSLSGSSDGGGSDTLSLPDEDDFARLMRRAAVSKQRELQEAGAGADDGGSRDAHIDGLRQRIESARAELAEFEDDLGRGATAAGAGASGAPSRRPSSPDGAGDEDSFGELPLSAAASRRNPTRRGLATAAARMEASLAGEGGAPAGAEAPRPRTQGRPDSRGGGRAHAGSSDTATIPLRVSVTTALARAESAPVRAKSAAIVSTASGGGLPSGMSPVRAARALPSGGGEAASNLRGGGMVQRLRAAQLLPQASSPAFALAPTSRVSAVSAGEGEPVDGARVRDTITSTAACSLLAAPPTAALVTAPTEVAAAPARAPSLGQVSEEMLRRTIRLTRAQMAVFLRDPLLVDAIRECGSSVAELCALAFAEFESMRGPRGGARAEFDAFEGARVARLRAVLGAAAAIERGRNAVAVAARHASVRAWRAD